LAKLGYKANLVRSKFLVQKLGQFFGVWQAADLSLAKKEVTMSGHFSVDPIADWARKYSPQS
jgi:hypothetical protein